MATNTKSIGAGSASPPPSLPGTESAEARRRALQWREKALQPVAFQPSGTLLSPSAALAWLLGLLAVAACVAPWLAHGWLWFDLCAAAAALFASYDGLALWLARSEFAPVLLPPEKGLRGREGQSLQVPLALAGSARRGLRSEVRLALMAATREAESAIRVRSGTTRLKLEQTETSGERAESARGAGVPFWPWSPEIALLRRGLWPVPRVGIERSSRLRFWRLRRWFESPASLRIDADLRPGRREMLRSPIYRAMVAARETPWTGHGRDFERLREYQPGDNYAEIAWKSTARRGSPVTRLFQWEQKQEVYFVVDQSRVSAQRLDPVAPLETAVPRALAPRRMLDLSVETALVGATVALELGDAFGLVTYADEAKSWLRAGSGQLQFHQFRDHLLNLEPLPTSADYEALFSSIRVRLRRRAYLVLLADLAERSVADSLCRGVALLRSSHVLMMTCVLPAYARAAFSAGERIENDPEVYAALAGEKENQRLGALARQLGQLGAELRFVSPASFLRTAVQGYLESKREQRV